MTDTETTQDRRARYFAGFREIAGDVYAAFASEGEIIVLGTPDECEDENDPRFHDCDAMGCGYDHVLFRAPLAVRRCPMPADPVPSPETTGTGETRTACEVCEDFAACQQSRGCTLSGAWEAEYAAALAMVQDAGNTVIPNAEYRRLVALAERAP